MNRNLGGLVKNTRDILKQKRKKIRKKGTRKLLKRWVIDRLTGVKSWRKRGNIYLYLAVKGGEWQRALLKYVYQLMTEITWEGDIKLEVMSTDVGGKHKSKRQIMSNWPGRRKKKNPKKQIQDWKNIHAEPVIVGKKFEKKEKRRTRKCVRKKMEKKENEGRYEHFFFCFH